MEVTITNMTKEIECEAQNHPAEDIDLGTRKIVRNVQLLSARFYNQRRN